MKIIGYKSKSFDFTDKKTGRPVHSTGFDISFAEPVFVREGEFGEGMVKAISHYFSIEKLAGYTPAVGDEVEILYDMWKKPAAIRRK